MCPYSSQEKSGPPNYMEDDLYRKILKELKPLNSVQSFSPMLQNEPLLDPEISKRVYAAKHTLNSVSVQITTNGSLLQQRIIEELVEAGTDKISISIDAIREETYQRIHRGLKYSKVLKNVYSLLHQDPKPVVEVRFLKQRANINEKNEFVRLWRARGAAVLVHSVINRAGAVKSFNKIKARETKTMKQLIRRILNWYFPFCPLPFYKLNVLWDGRVIFCCNDWGPTLILGDLSKQRVVDVWNGEVMNHYRHLLYTGQSARIPSCSKCTHKNGFWSSNEP
jgi:MoaA/NifB/PqqE/SkfB family radical SAM enzyme